MKSSKHLEVELRRLRSENTRLRKALRINGRHARRIQRAYDAALLLAQWHIAYLPTTREFAMDNGLTQRQWENGMALLRMARIVLGRRWQSHDLSAIERRLSQATLHANENPQRFFVHLPRH